MTKDLRGNEVIARVRIRPQALLVALLFMVRCAPAPEPPNLLLVVIDSLRADHLGAYGEPRGTSPVLDRLAREGRSFHRAYATAPWTLGSVGSMWTGSYASELGLFRLSSVLPNDVITLPEQLRERGFATGAVVSHTLVDSTRGFSRGFDRFDQEEAKGYSHVCTPGVTTRAQRILRELAPRPGPFFLFVHYFDPHFDYRDHPEYAWAGPAPDRFPEGFNNWLLWKIRPTEMTADEVRYIVDCYDEEIRLTDAGVGRLLRSLEEIGEAGRTMVVVVADHGEEFLQHRFLGHGANALLYEDVTRVPLIVHGPGIAPERDETPVSLLGLRAALLRLLGFTDPLPVREPVLPLRTLETVRPSPGILTEFLHVREDQQMMTRHALSGPRIKVMSCPPRRPVEVYDLIADPAERSNLAVPGTPLADSLLAVLHAEIAKLRVRDPDASPRTELSPAQREQLEALGYTGD